MHPTPLRYTPRTDRAPGPARGAFGLLVAWAALAVLPGGVPAADETLTGRDQAAATRLQSALALRGELFERLGVTRWHAAGRRGQGVKVAILDTGFRGYRDHMGTSLPRKVTVRSFRADGNLEGRDSQHGILCGEVIHALAPDAELLLANWEPDRPETFLDAVTWARREGARVLSCSCIMPSWSDGEGHGKAHEALTRLLGTGAALGDGLCFASAGNVARRHWSGTFRDHGDGFHEWRPGQADNLVTPWGTEEHTSVELCWRGDADYDVFVYDARSGAPVASSPARPGVARGCAVARFTPEPGHVYRARVRLARGPAVPFHFVALGADLGVAMARGSVCFPADGPEVLAVGAVDRSGKRMAYSACGPNSCGPKPDLVAVVPFPSLWRERPFAGTSAAAPQAAAAAALLWSAHPDWTARQVGEALRTAALDLGPKGHDFETGYGMVRLP
jgi:subtilisin family serine protease